MLSQEDFIDPEIISSAADQLLDDSTHAYLQDSQMDNITWTSSLNKWVHSRLEKKHLKNWIVFGRSGNGKSSLINNLMEFEAAEVSDSRLSVTREVQNYINETLGVQLIDCPGTDDTEEGIEVLPRINRELNDMIFPIPDEDSDLSLRSSYKIDGVILVVKMNPRLSFQEDLKSLKRMFGEGILKSTLFLIIDSKDYVDESNNSDDSLLKSFEKMSTLNHMMKKAKRGKPSLDWFVRWSNISPLPNQLESLTKKMSKLKPYSFNDLKHNDKEKAMKLEGKRKQIVLQLEEFKAEEAKNFELEKKQILDYAEIQKKELTSRKMSSEEKNLQIKTIEDEKKTQVEKIIEEHHDRIQSNQEDVDFLLERNQKKKLCRSEIAEQRHTHDEYTGTKIGATIGAVILVADVALTISTFGGGGLVALGARKLAWYLFADVAAPTVVGRFADGIASLFKSR